MEIDLQPEGVIVDGLRWEESPTINAVLAFANCETRTVTSPNTLSRLIVDELGLVFRFSQVAGRIHSLLVFFAVSPDSKQPRNPYQGSVIVNGIRLSRPSIVNSVVGSRGPFVFDRTAEPVSISRRVSIRLVLQNEYIHRIEVGWEDFPKYR
jgi:hypothetical protein